MRNHIRLPSLREPPEYLLRELREMDPVYDMHYLGDGRWAVGRVVPNSERARIASNIKRTIAAHPGLPRATARYRLVELAERGFGFVAFYEFLGEPTGEIVNDIKLREYVHRQGRDRHFEEVLSKSDFREPIDDSYFEEIEYREKHVAAQLFRHAKSFDQGRIQ